MKKTLVLAFFLVTAATPSFAQQGAASLKQLAVGKIYQYAVALYDRGNYPEAGQAFHHILELDPGYRPAMAYLRKLGLAFPEPLNTRPLASSTVVVDDPVVEIAAADSSNEDIRRRIAHEDKAIAELQTELPALRTGMESISQ